MKELEVMETKAQKQQAIYEEHKKLLRQIRKENAKKRMLAKGMFVMTSIFVFATGMIVGRVLAFLYAMGC